MPDPISDELSGFFDYMWGTQPVAKATFAYLPIKQNDEWHSYMFAWPRQKAAIIRHALTFSATGADVYFAPALFKAAKPTKANVLGSWVLWVDLDGNADEPDLSDLGVPKPTLVVQSSVEGHEHWYWHLDEFLTDTGILEDRNRALTYLLKADTSGWDADQVLRPIGTLSHKRGGLPVFVKDWEL
jgi:hypothetical protein